MNGKELLESMGYVDEKYIAEAEEAPGRRRHWQPLIAAAACLALVLAGVWEFLPRQEKLDAAPQAAAFQAKSAEAAEERSLNDQEEDQVFSAGTPMQFSGLVEMTIRVVERGEDALVCLVTDPGTSDYQVNDQVKIALPDANSQAEAEQAGAGEGTLYRVSFLPDQGAELINPAQWLPLEDE